MLKTLILKILNEGIQIKAATKGDLQNNEDGAYDPGECVGASIYILRETNGSYWISNEQNDVGNTDKFIRESTNSEKDLIILAQSLATIIRRRTVLEQKNIVKPYRWLIRICVSQKNRDKLS